MSLTTQRVAPPPQTVTTEKVARNAQGESFADILARSMNNNPSVNFSKHAQNRVVERGIDLVSGDMLERLTEGMELASEKGLGDALVLVDNTAFIINAKSNTVITTISGDDLTKNVFTNIEGTVIV